jgi:hypothetical protein
MDDSDNRRSSTRRRTILKGRVVLNSRASVFDCTVRDLSDTGAQLIFTEVFVIPQEFELEIPSKGLLRPVRVMWSRGKNHGIQFGQGHGV